MPAAPSSTQTGTYNRCRSCRNVYSVTDGRFRFPLAANSRIVAAFSKRITGHCDIGD